MRRAVVLSPEEQKKQHYIIQLVHATTRYQPPKAARAPRNGPLLAGKPKVGALGRRSKRDLLRNLNAVARDIEETDLERELGEDLPKTRQLPRISP